MNNTWFTWLWRCGPQLHILMPVFSRDNRCWRGRLKPLLDQPCMQQSAGSGGMRSAPTDFAARRAAYDRNEANAVFMAGDAVFTAADSTFYGLFNDPAKSKIASKVDCAFSPRPEPQAGRLLSLERHLGLGHPEGAARGTEEAREANAERLPGRRGWPDSDVEQDRRATAQHGRMEKDPRPVLGKNQGIQSRRQTFRAWRYYFANWPGMHKAFSDVVTKASSASAKTFQKC